MNMKKIICIMAVVVFAAYAVYAQEVKRTAKVISFNGKVEIKRAGQSVWIPAEPGMVLNEKDAVKTAAASEAVLNLDGTGQTARVELSPDTELRLQDLVKDEKTMAEKTLLDLSIGQVLIKAEKLDKPDCKFEVKTPTSIVGVRGTKFSVKVETLE